MSSCISRKSVSPWGTPYECVWKVSSGICHVITLRNPYTLPRHLLSSSSNYDTRCDSLPHSWLSYINKYSNILSTHHPLKLLYILWFKLMHYVHFKEVLDGFWKNTEESCRPVMSKGVSDSRAEKVYVLPNSQHSMWRARAVESSCKDRWGQL